LTPAEKPVKVPEAGFTAVVRKQNGDGIINPREPRK